MTKAKKFGVFILRLHRAQVCTIKLTNKTIFIYIIETGERGKKALTTKKTPFDTQTRNFV